MKQMKRVEVLSDIPKEPHYVIIKTVSVNIPGDERSRTNPGHGYPAHTEHYVDMYVTSDKSIWVDAVAYETQLNPGFGRFVAYFVPNIATVSTVVEVNV